MKLLWVSGTLPLSKLIMWGLNEPVSHFAICFDDTIVFHSDLTGMHISWFATFQKTHKVVYSVDVQLPLEQEEEIYKSLITKYDGSGYDYGAFCYFIYRAALLKFFKKPLPNTNPWGSKTRFLCDEEIQLLPTEIVGEEIKKMDLAMRSPFMVLKLILQFKPELRNRLEAQDQESLNLLS
jgi:hypothetical protein